MGKFKVGDTVIVQGSYNESRYGEKSWEDKIAKVGRKYVYLEGRYDHEAKTAFDAETGYQKPTGFSGSERTIYLPEEWDAKVRRKVVGEAIREHGLKPDGYGDFKQSTDVLEAILAILESK